MSDQSADDDLTGGTEGLSHRVASPSTQSVDQGRPGLSPSATHNHGPDAPPASSPSDRVVVLAIGDVHGLYEPVFAARREAPDASAILQVGDLTAGKPGRETHVDGDPNVIDGLAIPFIWVHGNHEHWELFGNPRSASGAATGRGDAMAPRLPGRQLWAGTHAYVPGTGIGVVGLPGNYAPTWYGQPKPFPGDRRRHFNRDDVEAMARHPCPNVLLMHEAFRGQAPGRVGMMGIPVLARLVAELQPAVVLTGHHHVFAVARHGPTLAISLPPAWEGYARLEFRRSGALVGWEFFPFNTARQATSHSPLPRGISALTLGKGVSGVERASLALIPTPVVPGRR